ncbi:hypothetical protein AB0D49_26140 [Streptomyces sp. NPDC048290]|uniref:hypothetical protein n=1 Tax=Streptomyces sp. NPDC048290 TaxID=3155811 RepID=UPI0034234BE8
MSPASRSPPPQGSAVRLRPCARAQLSLFAGHPRRYSTERVAEDLVTVLDELSVDRADVYGHRPARRGADAPDQPRP